MRNKLQARLRERQAHQLLRQRLTTQSAQSTSIQVNGKRFLNFSSNDYLGLANHPKMLEAIKDASKHYGAASGASHLVIGHSALHDELERKTAEFLGVERALLFSSGFMANYGVLTALFDKKDWIIQDKLNHASLIDGGLASAATMSRFGHVDIDSLQRQLQKAQEKKAETRLVVTDGVFSMDGDIAPLKRIIPIVQKHKAQLMIDDAHGFGVLGKCGRGSLEFFQMQTSNADIYMATFSKALGGYGAFVAGSELLIDSLIQFARSYIYTTALPAAVTAMNLCGLDLIQQETWRREHLINNIAYFKKLAVQADLPLMPSDTAIQPIMVGSNERVVKISKALNDLGILLVAIRPPTVPEKSARLRVALSAEHSHEQIEQLVTLVEKVLMRY